MRASTAVRALPKPQIRLKTPPNDAYKFSFGQLVGDEPTDAVILKLEPETPYEMAFEARHLISSMAAR